MFKFERKVCLTTLFSSKSPLVHVRPLELQCTQDIFDLADMRYHEWIQVLDDKTEKTPSLGAFRMATAEIVHERTRDGAVTFLARMNNLAKVQAESTVVGSAELSPIELQGLVPASHLKANKKWLYVTDVLTCTNHRRLGVGTALMDAMENAAVSQNGTRIYLHVHPENIGAIEFYIQRGYQTSCCPEEVIATKLAEAAGAIGQTLLRKELAVSEKNHIVDHQNQKRNGIHPRTKGGKGFGKQNH